MKTEMKWKWFITLNNLHISSSAVISTLWDRATEQLGNSFPAAKTLMCCGLSCKEIMILMSFTVRDAMRSQELPAPSDEHGSPPNRVQNCQGLKNSGTAQMDYIKLKNGRKVGFVIRSDHTVALVAAYLKGSLCPSFRPPGLETIAQSRVKVACWAGKKVLTGPKAQGLRIRGTGTANTSPSWKHLLVTVGCLSPVLSCQKMRCVIHVTRLGSFHNLWTEGF